MNSHDTETGSKFIFHEKSSIVCISVWCMIHDVLTFSDISQLLYLVAVLLRRITATIDCTGIDQLPTGSNVSCSVDGEPSECKSSRHWGLPSVYSDNNRTMHTLVAWDMW